ncbi:GntR family transcriptional regulator [Georgenia sp. SYP-B2076]|uniref:GntR family transcriptional regulator n=1 Tax=Georgenia sp. SYP-B2076 TaxID=2495881 RepID=UPI000F8CAD2E|nr:GntR family transcriptional regulator [Georgenia sp. SYP-B2076]
MSTHEVGAQGAPTGPPDRTASERIVAGLRAQILGGHLPPGSRIRQEELAHEFGASRLPVREALRLLEAEGLVRLVAHTGAWVARLSLQECTEAYLVREQLEPLLLSQSLPHLTDDDVERLADLVGQMERADLERFLVLDREFHLLSFSAATTPVLHEQVLRLWNTTQHYRRAFAVLVDIQHSRTTHYEHALLVDAVRRHDVEDAQVLQRMHIRRTRHELARHPEVFDTA